MIKYVCMDKKSQTMAAISDPVRWAKSFPKDEVFYLLGPNPDGSYTLKPYED